MSLFRRYPPHRHHWQAIDVDHAHQPGVGAITGVLKHCDGCGEHRVETVVGHWEPASFLTPSPHKGE